MLDTVTTFIIGTCLVHSGRRHQAGCKDSCHLQLLQPVQHPYQGQHEVLRGAVNCHEGRSAATRDTGVSGSVHQRSRAVFCTKLEGHDRKFWIFSWSISYCPSGLPPSLWRPSEAQEWSVILSHNDFVTGDCAELPAQLCRETRQLQTGQGGAFPGQLLPLHAIWIFQL